METLGRSFAQMTACHAVRNSFFIVLVALAMNLPFTQHSMAGGDLALEAKPYTWIVRVRGLGVLPSGDSTALQPVSGALGGPALIEAQDNYVPELDITYMLTKNLGVELILGVTKHDIDSKGTLAPLAPGKVAEAWLLPPTLTLQYHFNPDGVFRPYVGVGLNVTLMFEEEATASLVNGTGLNKVDIDTSVGVALQAGFDYQLTDKWFFNADVKYIHMEPDVTLTGGPLVRQTLDAEINPVVVGIGIGTRF